MVLRLVPLLVAALLLGAHFLRVGNLGLMAVSVLVPFLLLIKRRWSLIVVQLLAYVGTVIWIQTTIMIVQERLARGMPWVRVVIILGVVALFTAWAGWLLNSAVVKENYSA